jgi:quaternary ammonium compound-resistance protein SugE
MEWMLLFLAGGLEIAWAVAMKYSEGFTRLVPSVLTAVGYAASAVFLAMALRKLPLGTAYAMWTGMGIVGTAVLGVLLFQEKLSLPQLVCVLLIVIGIAGLKLLGHAGKEGRTPLRPAQRRSALLLIGDPIT